MRPTTMSERPSFSPPYLQNTSYGQQYSAMYQPAISSHYAQAYLNTSNGYSQMPQNDTFSARSTSGATGGRSSQSFLTSAPWYQPGTCKCTYQGCTFIASHKSLEIHMMDRHLIYPAGWEKRRKKTDWDADPSLKGKPIPIQGTTVLLDSPEMLEAWTAERKKRWPTANRVEGKKRKMEEAIARGQLLETVTQDRKRRRTNESFDGRQSIGTRGRERQGFNGRGKRGTDSGWNGRGGRVTPISRVEAGQNLPPDPSPPSTDSESDTEPEVISSKKPSQKLDATPIAGGKLDAIDSPKGEQQLDKSSTRVMKRNNLQPMRREPQNPFASRPTLLRNLLLPEIRMTISNLSQAIRFLSDNDFLRGVELKAGETNERMIEVID